MSNLRNIHPSHWGIVSVMEMAAANIRPIPAETRATPERVGKRRNIARWRAARLRRLDCERKLGRATPRQLARIAQLEATGNY